MALLDFPSGPGTGDTYTLNGNMWKWNGTSWVAFNSLSLSSQVSGILAVQYGGTGFGGTYTAGDILYALSSNTFGKLTAGTAGSVLASGGPSTAPYWKVDDTGAGTVGSGTSGGFSYYTSTTNITSGSGFSYISGTNNVILTNGLLSLIGSTINSGTWAGNAISLVYGGTNNNLSGVGQSYQLAFYNATGTAITALNTGAGIANSILFQANNSSAPIWVGQSTLSVGLATSTSNKINVTTFTGAGTSYLYFGDVVSGYASIGATADITVTANSGTINAKFFSGIATSSTRVGITTNITDSSYPIVFSDVHAPYASLGSSTLLTYNPSNGKITNGIWAGTAITTRGGGTGLNTVNANQVLIGAASGNTWTAIASTNLPVAAISSAPPARPAGAIGDTQPGQLWWDSEFGVLKIYYTDATPTSQWVDATPVLGSSGGGSSTKRSYVMTFGAGFTPSTGADTVQILIPYAPDNTSKYYFIKRLDYRANTAGTGVSFYIERFTGGNAAFDVSIGNRIHSASGASFVAASGIFITSYTQSSSGASFVSSSGVAGSVISGDYLRLNYSHINSAATMSVSIILEEQ
jgi:hypothetical protein